jgi:geranyl diphosphate synthase
VFRDKLIIFSLLFRVKGALDPLFDATRAGSASRGTLIWELSGCKGSRESVICSIKGKYRSIDDRQHPCSSLVLFLSPPFSCPSRKQSAPRPEERVDSSVSSSPSASASESASASATPTAAAVALDPAAAAAAAADPFSLVAPEVEALSQRLRECVVATAVPVLSTAAEYFFRAGASGKRLRPTLVLLMAGATAPAAGHAAAPPVVPDPASAPSYDTAAADDFPARPANPPFFPAPTPDDALVDSRPPSSPPPTPRRAAQRLAEIAELIHVASLLHDDVIDDAALRRGLAAVNALMGNKVSVLAGDFLLARASVSLASIRDHGVTLLMSRVIEDLVAGEVAQMSARGDELVSLEAYERRCFLKTASLMSRSAQAAALLSGADERAAGLAARYGESLGLAFQVTDDALDYEPSSSALSLGKPAAADAGAGVVTAPALLAMQGMAAAPSSSSRGSELEKLVRRRFKGPGDPARAAELVREGGGCELARGLAARHADAAVRALRGLPPPAHAHGAACRVALESLARAVVQRKK